jgi:hypothetical protein
MSAINETMMKYLTEKGLDELIRDAHTEVSKSVSSKMKSYKDKDMDTIFQELAPEIDSIMSKHFLYFVGDIKNKVTSLLSTKFSPAIAKAFNTKYNKLGTRRANDR